MKKLFALLIAALLALLPALAEKADPLNGENPNPFGEIPGRGIADGQGIELDIDGDKVTLDFDPSEQYSSIEGGLVQASFYSYSADGVKLYELYMLFPDTAKSGSVIVPDASNLDSSVVLIVSDANTQEELYYFSSYMGDGVYPEGSDFSIAIDDVVEEGGARTYTGRLTATLVALDMATGQTSATLRVEGTPFSFTIGGAGERRAEPLPTAVPSDIRTT